MVELQQGLFLSQLVVPRPIAMVSTIGEDGVLNVLDLVSLVNIILLGESSTTADMNNDGYINILDAVILINIIISSN